MQIALIQSPAGARAIHQNRVNEEFRIRLPWSSAYQRCAYSGPAVVQNSSHCQLYETTLNVAIAAELERDR